MNPSYINRKKIIQKFNLTSFNDPNIKSIEKTDYDKNDSYENDSYENDSYKNDSYENDSYENESLSENIKCLLPDIDNYNINVNTPDEYSKYTYKLSQIINTDKFNNKSNKLIHICIFNIIESPKAPPFILYLLSKDRKENTMYFPHFTTSNNVMDETNIKINLIFSEWNEKPVYKGFLETNNNVYLFYENKYQYIISRKDMSDLWWWASMFEIVNTRKVLNFSVNRTVYSIFYKKPLLISIFHKENKIVTPYIGFVGGYYTYISFIAAFGIPKQSPTNNLGPYYYFSDYHGAGRWAIWSQDRKEKNIDGNIITIDKYGVFKKGGIARFAIFGDNLKYFLNRDNDEDDDSIISQKLAKEKDFYKDTLKVRDVAGKWAEKYDIAYIGSFLTKTQQFKSRRYNIQFAARDFYQQIPLTYHYINTSKFSKILDDDAQKSLPFNYTDYNIE